MLGRLEANQAAADATNPAGSAPAAPKPHLALDQIVTQLQTQWGGLLEGTTRAWASSTVSYALAGTAPDDFGYGEAEGFRPLSPHMRAMAHEAFELWDDLMALSLDEVAPADAGLTFALSTSTAGAGTYARTWTYGSDTSAAEIARSQVWVNALASTHDQDSDIRYGRYGFLTDLHEIGHALGLSHPGSYQPDANGAVTYGSAAEYAQDTRQFTIMSYFNAFWADEDIDHYGSTGGWIYPSTPMLHDVAAIQAKYGADLTTRAGDTTYGFHATADRAVFDFSRNPDPIVTIWDGGGVDTLDASGFGSDQHLSLIEGAYSSLGHLSDNVAIAYGAVIEHAIGGSGHDSLTGNAADNELRGGPGDDRLDGGPGADTLIGGSGNDRYVVRDGLDSVVESEGDGRDRIWSAVDLTLPDHVEGLVLQGGAVSGRGNGLDNTMRGNALDNVLNGGTGRDLLTGSAGQDTFVFDTALGSTHVDRITDFSHADDVIHLDHDLVPALGLGGLAPEAFKVLSNLPGGRVDASDRILYNPATGIASYDQDGRGGTAAVQIVVLVDKPPDITADDFLVI